MAYADYMFSMEMAQQVRTRTYSKRSIRKFARRHKAATEWELRSWPEDYSKSYSSRVHMFENVLMYCQRRMRLHNVDARRYMNWMRENLTGYHACPLPD